MTQFVHLLNFTLLAAVPIDGDDLLVRHFYLPDCCEILFQESHPLPTFSLTTFNQVILVNKMSNQENLARTFITFGRLFGDFWAALFDWQLLGQTLCRSSI